jgi:CRISPR-associated protein Cas5h
MKTLVFTAKGQYARFRCPHTTTSALTFLTIHPIAVKGMIGAIMGIEYERLFDYTKDMKVAIEVLNPVYTDTQSFNLIAQSNNNGAANFQSRIQFLRDVYYRIYIQDNKVDTITNILQSGEFGFTPYLGCSEHIAKIEFEEIIQGEEIQGNFVNTIIPKNYINIEECDDIKLYSDRIPVKNKEDREYTQYSYIAFSSNNPLPIMASELIRVGEKNVFFL